MKATKIFFAVNTFILIVMSASFMLGNEITPVSVGGVLVNLASLLVNGVVLVLEKLDSKA